MPPTRAALVTAYADYLTCYPSESPRLEQVTNLLVYSCEDPGAPTTLPAHITASAALLDPRGRVLLTHQGPRWAFPGGHLADVDRSPLHAALRHLVQETGLPETAFSVTPLQGHIPLHYTPVETEPDGSGHLHHDLLHLLVFSPHDVTESLERLDRDGREYRWVDPQLFAGDERLATKLGHVAVAGRR